MQVKKVLRKRKRDTDIIKFQESFKDEEACRQYLFNLKWPAGFVCGQCGNNQYHYVKSRNLYQCAQCKKQHSVTNGTVLHRSHLKLRQWFWAIYLVSRDKRGYSAIALKNAIHVSYPTAWLLLQKIRTAMAEKDKDYILDGIIMVDDAFFGSKTKGKKRGRGTEKQNVLVSVSITKDSKPRFAKMKTIPNMKDKTIDNAVHEMAEPESQLISDGHRTLMNLKNFAHEVVIINHDTTNALDVFKPVHRIISNAKAVIRSTYHGVSDKHRQKYLDEYCYRLNRRFCEHLIFGKLVSACILAKPISYAELTL
jgi:transposase-like protein